MMIAKIKYNNVKPNYYNFKVRIYLNRKQNVDDKSIKKYSPIFLGDSFRFTIATVAFFSLWLSVLNIAN